MLEDRAKVESFTSFVRDVEPRLRHSLIPSVGLDAATEATAEALAYGWEHWDRLRHMDNPAGYLYRVARTKARQTPNRMPLLPEVSVSDLPHVEPGLPTALRRLSEKQRSLRSSKTSPGTGPNCSGWPMTWADDMTLKIEAGCCVRLPVVPVGDA
jgi:DNA-directed RNA polymerase specialized sigma24 family protein